MTNYFTAVSNVAEIKALYRKLAMANHPDTGGSEETMKDLNTQYHAALKGEHGKDFEGRQYKYNSATEQELMDIISKLAKLEGLDIALIGYWIWVQGDTKPHRAELKASGLKWHSKRLCWYYKPAGFRRTRPNSKADLSELEGKYGYRNFTGGKTEDRQQLSA